MSIENIIGYIFFVIFIIFGMLGYLYFGRDYRVDKKIIQIFGQQNSRIYTPETQDFNLLSPFLKKDNGDVSLVVAATEKTKILTYYVGVTGRLSKLRYLVLISETTSELDAIYGSEYIYRVAKYNKLYSSTFHEFINVPLDILYLPEYVEAIEVFNGRSYSFYRLPMFFGYTPLDRVVAMLGIN